MYDQIENERGGRYTQRNLYTTHMMHWLCGLYQARSYRVQARMMTSAVAWSGLAVRAASTTPATHLLEKMALPDARPRRDPLVRSLNQLFQVGVRQHRQRRAGPDAHCSALEHRLARYRASRSCPWSGSFFFCCCCYHRYRYRRHTHCSAASARATSSSASAGAASGCRRKPRHGGDEGLPCHSTP